jgi:hypothetical protein
LQIAVIESRVAEALAELELRAKGGIAEAGLFGLEELVVVADEAVRRARVSKRKMVSCLSALLKGTESKELRAGILFHSSSLFQALSVGVALRKYSGRMNKFT